MTHRIGYISGSAKHHHKIHILVELGPRRNLPDEHSGGEYEVGHAVTACGLDSRTLSKHHWMALVIGSRGDVDEESLCANCRRKIGK